MSPPPNPTPSAASGAGAGGKFRRHPLRKSTKTTPYSRPATATRNPSWLSKLVVEPASKLINSAARRFFSSVFSKRLPPPPDEEQEERNGLQETALDAQIDAGLQEPVANVCGTSTSYHDTSGIQELEQLLKQTFTRSEIDHLTGLLKSRAMNLPVNGDGHGVELNPSVQDSERLQEFPMTSTGNIRQNLGGHRAVLDNTLTAGEQNMQHLEDQIASPSQLAKAYMSSRPTVSPSTLGLRAQIAWEDSAPPTNAPYTSKSRPSPLPLKTSCYSGAPGNGFTTPRFRGRSAIYHMARTPYSRVLPVSHQKVSGSDNYSDSKPPLLASRSAMENGGQVASKPMALKRRSTVLDEDIGSIGPIRRIRQKHNLLPQGKSVTISGKGLGSNFTDSPKRYFIGNVDSKGASTSSANYAHVPRQSSEMAAKILEHLEKMTPKEKSVESKLAAAREGSTFKLLPHMLHGQALKSMEDLDSSKFLTNSLKEPKVVDQPVSHLPNSHKISTQRQVRIEEQAPVKSAHPEDKLTSDGIIQGSDKSSLGHGAMLSSSSQPVEKKHPFKMSAQEDWIEIDDECCNEQEPELAGKALEEPLRDGKSALNEDTTLNKSPVSLERTPATPVFSSTQVEGDKGTAGENNTGINFPTSFATNTSSQKVFSQSTKVGNSPLILNSGTATTRSNPTSVESKDETSSSLKNVFSGITNAAVRVAESDTTDKKNPESDNTVNGNQGKPPSPAFNPVAANNNISVDARSSNLASNDGALASSVDLSFNSSGPPSVILANQNFTNSFSNTASSAGATTSASTLPDSAHVPANGTSLSFSESASGNIFSTKISKIGGGEATDVKVEKVNGFGNLSNSSTVSTFSETSNGSSIFGFGTSSSSAVNSQWPSSTNGTSDHKESSLTGSGSGNVSLSTPVHFGSSSSAMGFGLSGVTPLTSSGSFNSSVPITKSEGTTQSSASPLASNPVNSIKGTVPTFNFGGGASSSSGSNVFSSTATTSPGAFQFGASSTTPASSSSSPSSSLFGFNAGSSASPSAISNGPSAGVFGFSSGSSSSAISVSNTSSGLFNFGAGASVSASSTNPVTSSSSPAPIFSFGATAPAPSPDANGANSSSFASSLQASKSTFGSPLSMPSSTAFSFGGSSPAFGTSNSSMVFGSTTGASPSPTFGFPTAASSPLSSTGAQNVFGNSASPFTTTPGNNHQMSPEDCMAEDPIQSLPATPLFGQSLASPSPPSFMFGSAAPSQVAPFQFPSQQSQVGQHNPSFQASSSLEFNAGGSFSLGSGGEKSGRKIVKVNRNRNRKLR